LWLETSPDKKLEILSQSMSWEWWHTLVVPVIQETTGRHITVTLAWTKICEDLPEKYLE
jgi:hypothetical protein